MLYSIKFIWQNDEGNFQEKILNLPHVPALKTKVITPSFEGEVFGVTYNAIKMYSFEPDFIVHLSNFDI
jgi:hypothetical protein